MRRTHRVASFFGRVVVACLVLGGASPALAQEAPPPPPAAPPPAPTPPPAQAPAPAPAPAQAPPEKPAEPPAVHAGAFFVGAFVNGVYSDNTRTQADGSKTGAEQVTIGADLTFGRMLTDHWGVLLNGGYQYEKTDTFLANSAGASVTLEGTAHPFFLAPAARYYHQAGDSTFLFAEAKLGAGIEGVHEQSLTRTNTINTVDARGISVFGHLGFGVTSFLTQHLAAEALIGIVGFKSTRVKNDTGFKHNETEIDFLIYKSSVNIGLVYYLGT